MTFVPGYNSRYYAGPIRLSVQGRSFSSNVNVAQLEVPSEGRAKSYINGQRDGSAQIDMALDTAYAALSQYTTLLTWRDTSTPVTFGMDGVAAGAATWMLDAVQSSLSVSSEVAGTVDVSVQMNASLGVDWGAVIAAETQITTDTNGASVDNGASTANGGVAHLHVTEFTGLTSNDITIEHSTNNSVWATLATFTQYTATGSERIVVAPGTTVNRYLRVVDNVTGTGSTTRLVAFARR